ncbi:Nif11-like leader peptide family RiPP precursor [Synechococcus lacustris]|uniref:Nif11-like leader peptide family RiPP precursor n=1 Tax=Synechococcus lacustris TaxID=2116544 RepID=UPI0020CE643D|nr:Nif11-like leader peptide family RiPP precursor [Synechococcus lacustris]MCP9814999.1 Nif11-like leader peptide family RiPP precursor [Synechococcus lacustris L1E-Slac]
MSEEQLAALLAKLKEDAGLQEKLKGAADLDAAIALAKEAGFDVSKADWLKYQAKQTLELSDEELEMVAGGAPYQIKKWTETGTMEARDTCTSHLRSTKAYPGTGC